MKKRNKNEKKDSIFFCLTGKYKHVGNFARTGPACESQITVLLLSTLLAWNYQYMLLVGNNK